MVGGGAFTFGAAPHRGLGVAEVGGQSAALTVVDGLEGVTMATEREGEASRCGIRACTACGVGHGGRALPCPSPFGETGNAPTVEVTGTPASQCLRSSTTRESEGP
jgi:hypothetical protein